MLPQEFSLINYYPVWESFPKSGSEMDSRITPRTAGKPKNSHYIMKHHTYFHLNPIIKKKMLGRRTGDT